MKIKIAARFSMVVLLVLALGATRKSSKVSDTSQRFSERSSRAIPDFYQIVTYNAFLLFLGRLI